MRTRRSQFSGNPMPSGSDHPGHRTVLLHEAVEALAIQADDVVVDATLGGLGHAQEILKYLGTDGTFVGFDADRNAIERARAVLHIDTDKRIHLVNANFRDMRAEVKALGIDSIDKAVFDLGWSGYQLAEGRGFSFFSDEPLHMGYAQDQALTADIIVNDWEETSIADIIFGWGEERYSRKIARAIHAAREKGRIKTARELADIVKASVPSAYRFGRIHPATKTFQALRIAVNDELGALKDGLQSAFELLKPEGRIAVISFHSIEDRIVKRMFAEWDRRGTGTRLTKKPIVPTETEIQANPRSRSAKLRVIQKI